MKILWLELAEEDIESIYRFNVENKITLYVRNT